MSGTRRLSIVVLCIIGMGCAPKHDYTSFYLSPPRSVLVVPIMNDSVEIFGPKMLITSVTRPIAERGYYVFPVMLTDTLFRDLGLPEAGLIHQWPPQEFHERFGADSVLFITITKWASQYIVIQNTRKIRAHYRLVDTRSGRDLWNRTQEIAYGSGGGNIIEMVVKAAIDKLLAEAFESQFRPVARQLNFVVFSTEGSGLPAGPYHEKHGQDRAAFPGE